MSQVKLIGFIGVMVMVLSLSGLLGDRGFQPRLAQGADEYDHIRVGLSADIAGVDPLNYPTLTRASLNVHRCMFEHLFDRTEEGKIVGNLATGYKWVNDKTFRVTLRKGVTFHDGSPFTAEDVKYSIEDMVNPDRGPGLASTVKGIKEVRILDEYTVDIITAEPIPTLPAKLSCYTLMVSSKQRAKGDPKVFGTQPIGTGAFKFIEWIKGQRVVLERYDKYWKGVPRIKKLTFFTIPDNSTRVSALKSGSIDIALDVIPTMAKDLKTTQGIEVTSVPSVRAEMVWIRTDQAPFSDKRVRLAMNYAINTEEFIGTLTEGFGTPLSGQPWPPYFFGYNPELKPYPYDPERAKRLLAEAGYPKGFTTILEGPSLWEEKIRGVAGYLQAIGIDCKIEVKEWNTAYADMLERKMRPLFYWSWGNWSLMDVDGTLRDCFGCVKPEIDQGKWSYYCNPRMEEIIKGMRTIDDKERTKLAWEAGRIIHEEAPMIPLFIHPELHAKRAGIPEFKSWRDNMTRFDWVKGK